MQFGQDTQWGYPAFALGSFVRRGSTGGRGSHVRVAERVRLARSSGWQTQGRPGGCASHLKSSSRGLPVGAAGFLTWRPRCKGRHPGRAGPCCLCPALGVTWHCVDRLLCLRAVAMSTRRQGGDTHAETRQKGEKPRSKQSKWCRRHRGSCFREMQNATLSTEGELGGTIRVT